MVCCSMNAIITWILYEPSIGVKDDDKSVLLIAIFIVIEIVVFIAIIIIVIFFCKNKSKICSKYKEEDSSHSTGG